MTIITLAYCVNNKKILDKLYNITIYDDEFINQFIKKNKKCYKLIKIKLDRCNINYLLEYYSLMDFSNASQFTWFRKIERDEEFSILTVYIIIWNIMQSKQWLLKDFYDPVINKYYKCYQRNKFNMKNNYKIRTKYNQQEGSISLSYDGEQNRHDHGNIIHYLTDEQINIFMLLNNMLFYFENKCTKFTYPFYYTSISKNIEVEVKYHNYENHKYMNMIDTCLPICKTTKNLLFEKQLKLYKNTMIKIIKIIHVYQFLMQNYHNNIIYGIINKII